jgi:hypothetical protein
MRTQNWKQKVNAMSFARIVVGFLLLCVAANAQQYVISTYAGGAPPATPSPAVAGSIGAPTSVATDAMGNVYFASLDLNVVFKLDPDGVLTRVAGSSRRGYSGDGGPATNAQLRLGQGYGIFIAAGLAVDRTGNLFIADAGNYCIRRVSLNGARRFVDGLAQPPSWMPRILEDWERTLRALEEDDREWLCGHLGAFAKHGLIESWLEQNELEASELPGNRRAFEELTLLEHDYALLDRSRGVFDSLLQNGLIAPSGRPVIPPGGEPEPFVSEVNTRARARARFLVENHSRTDLEMNWSYVRCTSDGRYRELFDPCAEEYGDWQMP